MTDHDRHLGMGSSITRRDFINGVAIGAGGALAAGSLSPDLEALLAQGSPAYPPALTGLRGSHAGSFEAFHAMKDGAFWKDAPVPRDTGEQYDLVVVGAGISGLAAAHYFRKARPDARVLVLDNHDDFGGHAKRNEFTHNGRTYIGYGGTQSIDSPAPVQRGGEGAHRRTGHRRRAVSEGARRGPLHVARPAPGVLLRQGDATAPTRWCAGDVRERRASSRPRH